MGNTSSALGECLLDAVGGNEDLVAFPDKPLYQLTDVKPYNLDIPVEPAAVTYPETSQHVADIIKCASEADVKVQARSGGHSYANYGLGGVDGAVVVDMKNFQHFEMDTDSWEATIGSGTLLGDVTERLHDAGGRAMAHGTCPQVGIGGHATIGGLGPSSRMWGAALDHILEVEVVLANSTVTRASETQNPDLFFALKGAAAGFGVITEFKVKTHDEPGEAVEYSYTLNTGSAEEMATTFKSWQTFISDPALSRKFASQIIVMELGILVSGTYFGSRAEFDALDIEGLFPSKPSANVLVFRDFLGLVGHWAEDVALEIGGGISSAFYSKSLAFTPDDLIPDSGVDNLFEYIETVDKGTAIWFAIFDLEGGAVNDVPADATAYGHRDALFYMQTYAVNIGSVSETTRSFVTGMDTIIRNSMPDTDFGAYAGYVDPALGDDAQRDYWGDNLPKLERIKSEVDPQDLFHNPQSVRPRSE
ncbi:hypothetical protein BDY21DRAFT_281402 [Lineolata rhizophorae]|uniref:FAD-binding PCMH-type domain-containing protein n=1 Tax=Lineolata rhizophorae TaxID=578093 RepID=A0A6A6P7T2_9PEZI|nr:hypothetical protein BDY21DRAFT_281402 [Lineolata rhizophorae]